MKHVRITRMVYAISFAGALFSALATRGDTPAFSFEGESAIQPPSFNGTRGWRFFHGGMVITELGVYDSGGDGLMNPHSVGVWRDDGTLLASGTVPSGTSAPLVDGYRYVAISPVVFNVSGFATIAGQYSDADADDLATPNPGGFSGVVAMDGRYGFGSNLPFPSLATPDPEGGFGYRYWEPNFQFVPVPEPSVVLLISSALLCLLWRRCRGAKLAGSFAK